VTDLVEIGPGLWRWSVPHPDWQPRYPWGPDVTSYAVHGDEATFVVDALVPEDDVELLAQLDELAPNAILVLKPDHTRSAAWLQRRWHVPVYAGAAVALKLGPRVPVREIRAGDAVLGLRVLGDRRGREETPVWLPAHRALAFADAVMADGDGHLHVWLTERLDEEIAHLRSLLDELPVERVLVTHGEPVLDGGAEALEAAFGREPWAD